MMQTFITYQTTFADLPVWFPGLDYGIVRADIPKRVDLDEDVQNHFLLELGRGILRQALQDCHNSDPEVRNEAREWLLQHGERWAVGCGIDFIDGDAIQRHLQKGKKRVMKTFKRNREMWNLTQ